MFRQLIRSLPLLTIMLVAMGTSALAQADLGPQQGAAKTSSSSQLNLTATGQKSIQLDISTAASGATVVGNIGNTSTGIFSLDFGNVDGLGINSGNANVTVSVSSTGATYTTPITLTPHWSGFATATSSVSVLLDATSGNALGRAATREGASAATVAAPNSTATVFNATAASGAPLTRFVGMFISNANGAGAVTGSLTSRLVYQVTVP
jgi:hypothetical protein